ncbi:MAG: single-stranded DNA-binding protein, partial [Deltaproteobacteria bacterium]|nr:single-stranded DNA-binding protein [Deltaproteobacteria bacterium]
RIQTREWEDKDGHKRSTTEINAQTVQFLGGMRGEADAGPAPTTKPSGGDPGGGPSGGSGEGGPPAPGDDIPF